MVIKAKIHVSKVTKTAYAETIEAAPVCSSDPNDPNKSWSEATPSGSVELCITNKQVFGHFVPGEEYLLTFEHVPKEAPKA